MENRTRNLLACSAVPQPTAPPAACPHRFSIQCLIHYAITVSVRVMKTQAGVEERISPIITKLSPTRGKLSASVPGQFTAGTISTKIQSGRIGGEYFLSTLAGNRTAMLGKPKPQAIHCFNYVICALTSRLCERFIQLP
jgi:hypothetical protein